MSVIQDIKDMVAYSNEQTNVISEKLELIIEPEVCKVLMGEIDPERVRSVRSLGKKHTIMGANVSFVCTIDTGRGKVDVYREGK